MAVNLEERKVFGGRIHWAGYARQQDRDFPLTPYLALLDSLCALEGL